MAVMEVTIRNEMILKKFAILEKDMIKEALIKATVPLTFMVLFLIIGLAPLYVMYGIIDRNIPVKTR